MPCHAASSLIIAPWLHGGPLCYVPLGQRLVLKSGNLFNPINYTLYKQQSEIWPFVQCVLQVRVVLLSVMKIQPMFFSVLSVKFTGRVKFGAMRLSDAQHQKAVKERLNVSRIPVYKVVTPEEVRTFGTHVGEYLSYQSMALLLRTLHPEVNDIFLLSLIIVNLACSLELFITRGGPLKRVGRALWCTVKWNFLLILLWLPVLGLFQLPYIDAAFGHILTVLRLIGMTRFAGCVRADWLWWYSTVIGWLFLIITFLGYAVVIGWLHHLYGSPLPVDGSGGDDYGLGRLWATQWESYLSTIFQPAGISRQSWMNGTHSRGAAEVGMELLIERLAVPNLWLQPIISSQYIHNLPVWKHRGPCRVDSDVGSDRDGPSTPAEDQESPSGDECRADPKASSGICESDLSWTLWFGQQRPLMFVCERCRALQTSATLTPRSEQELEQERLESESACAKYLMDGNYRCMCGLGGGGRQVSEPSEDDTTPHHHRQRPCSRLHPVDRETEHSPIEEDPKSERNMADDFGGFPPGIIPMTDCSICLESYKYGTVLCGLPCGHSFHQQCIMGWLSRDNHCCPVCRWPAYKAKPCNMHQHYD